MRLSCVNCLGCISSTSSELSNVPRRLWSAFWQRAQFWLSSQWEGCSDERVAQKAPLECRWIHAAMTSALCGSYKHHLNVCTSCYCNGSDSPHRCRCTDRSIAFDRWRQRTVLRLIHGLLGQPVVACSFRSIHPFLQMDGHTDGPRGA